MRIVGGRLRGRRLTAPEDRDTRPTSDRAREAVFNILEAGRLDWSGAVIGSRVLDAFAGTGALGLEALSRDAAAAVFMETSPAARRLCRTNIAVLDLENEAELLACSALKPPPADQPCDLIFLDPPYGQGLAAAAVAALDSQGWIAEEALLLVELEAKEPFTPPDGFKPLDERRYGKARMVFLARGRD